MRPVQSERSGAAATQATRQTLKTECSRPQELVGAIARGRLPHESGRVLVLLFGLVDRQGHLIRIERTGRLGRQLGWPSVGGRAI